MTLKTEDISWYDAGTNPFEHKSTFEGDSIQAARAWMTPKFRKGDMMACPCCGLTVKLYARSINSSMVSALAIIARRGPITPRDMGQRGGDYGKLIHWGIIKKTDDNKHWIITSVGRSFLKGETRVPKYILLFNDIVMGASIQHVDVHEATDSIFVYEETMSPFLTPETADVR